MGVTRWLLHKFKDINSDRMKKHIEVIHQNSGKSKAYIVFDMFVNFLTRGSGYTDYFRGNYIQATKTEKDTFVTAKKFYKILEYLNDDDYIVLLNDKLVFDRFFNEYLKRDYLNLRETDAEGLKQFMKGRDIVFAKLTNGECGHGISKIVVKDVKDYDALYKELVENNQLLVEEAIIQNDDLNEINPNAVNSFRVITLYKDGKVYLVNNALRINQDESNVIGCSNDLYFSLGEDGRIDGNVIDDYGNVYDTHPLTGKKFKDVKIAGVKEAFDMCKEAHMRIPQVRYIGWDIAFSVKGPVVVEGNEYPGFGLVQHYKLKDKSTGHLKEISDILGDEMKNIKL